MSKNSINTTKYVLLLIGILGLTAVGWALYNGGAFKDQIITLVCAVSLLYGFTTLNSESKK